jgi:hypothetical protein
MPIPPGAQQVHVVAVGNNVSIDPPSVRAGDVYVVVDGPVIFFEHSAAAQGEPFGPMTDEELARLAQEGDTSGTVGTSGMASVTKFTLAAGKYAFVPTPNLADGARDPLTARADLCARDAVACAALPPLPMAILWVLP